MKSDLSEIDFYIGPYGISVDRCVLVGCNREEIKLTPKNMGVLAYLAEHSERVISSDELLNKFWSPIASDHAVHKAIADLRSALGDSVRRQAYIKTLPRRGYQLLHAPTRVPPSPPDSDPEHQAGTGRRAIEFGGYLAMGFGTALVVAVFVWLLREPGSKKNADAVTVGVEQFTVRGNASQAGRVIGEGLAGNLIGQLSKSKQLNIVFIDGAAGPQPETDHLLRGTLLHLDGRLRVLVHLVRSSDGVYEYSEKFDFELSEQSLFTIEDHIVSSAVHHIARALDIRQEDLRDTREYSLNTLGYRRLAKGDGGTAGH